jgi:integrase
MLKKFKTRIGKETVRGVKRFTLNTTDPSGKRTRKFFNSLKEARDAEKLLWLDYNEHGARDLNLSHEDRLRFVTLDRQCRKVGTTLEKAVEIGLGSLVAPDPIALKEGMDAYIQSKVNRRCRPRTVQTVLSRIRQLVEMMPKDAMCSDVTPAMLRDMVHRNGWSPMTMRNRMVEYGAFFRWLVRNAHMANNPAEHMDRIIVDPTPPRVLTPEELRRLLGWCWENDRGMAGWIAIGAFCGIRPAEINRLPPQNIDLKSKVVLVESTKIRDNRYVDIPDNAIPWLGEFSTKGSRKRFEKARRETGLLDDWPPDGLRNSCASYYAALWGVDKSKDRLGHKGDSRTFFVHYRVPVLKDAAEEWFRITPEATGCPITT